MSTKTLRKRIALVAVSALGFGLISGTAAQAAGYTSGLTQSWTAMTVISDQTTATNGYFYVDTTNLNGTTSTEAGLESGETITVSVVSAPLGQAITDLNINAVKNSGAATTTAFTDAAVSGAGDESVSVTSASNAASPNNSIGATEATTNEVNRYWFAVNADAAGSVGSGKYTIRIRLSNANSEVKDYTLTVKFVPSIADAVSVLTLSKTGSITTGANMVTTANTSVYATLRDADGGRIQVGQPLTSGTRIGWDPALNQI